MSPRTSVRALAREIYGELAEKELGTGAGTCPQATPTPDPSPQGGGEKTAGLMAQVRALYEQSAVPVREIARRAGVTERTLYKYAQKHGWRPRYQWRDDHACMLGRGWRAAEDFAPAQGAGGRFVRREDAGKPFAQGLKALDPAARARAEAVCAEAQARAQRAQQKAELERLNRDIWAAVRLMNRSMDEVIRYRESHPAPRRDPEIERLLLQSFQYAVGAVRGARLAREQFAANMLPAPENPALRRE